jgi:hypothetical protein
MCCQLSHLLASVRANLQDCAEDGDDSTNYNRSRSVCQFATHDGTLRKPLLFVIILTTVSYFQRSLRDQTLGQQNERSDEARVCSIVEITERSCCLSKYNFVCCLLSGTVWCLLSVGGCVEAPS